MRKKERFEYNNKSHSNIFHWLWRIKGTIITLIILGVITCMSPKIWPITALIALFIVLYKIMTHFFGGGMGRGVSSYDDWDDDVDDDIDEDE